MSVTLKPDKELGFQRPLTQLVKRSLSVTNSNSQPVAFKVKTTAPKQYCVRPNSGRIEPGETVQVQVLLQPMKDDPPEGAKCRDKFLVQSVYITPERESQSLQDLWSSVEKEGKESAQIHEHKIRCAYLAADAAASSPDQSNGNGHDVSTDDHSAAVDASSSSSPALQQVQEKASGATTAVASGAAAGAAAVGLTGLAKSLDPKSESDASASSPRGDETTTPKMTSSSAEQAKEKAERKVDTASLETKLAAAQTEIRQLKDQLKASQDNAAVLRNRSNAASASNEKGGAAVAQQHHQVAASGVPINVVLGIAFAVFLLTWLFF